jgi:hypothetical protein
MLQSAGKPEIIGQSGAKRPFDMNERAILAGFVGWFGWMICHNTWDYVIDGSEW